MELIFRVGSTKILNNNRSLNAFNSGLDEKQSRERAYFVVEKYYDYEERHYPSCTIVATKLKAKNNKSAGIVERYLRLRNYFKGENESDFQMDRLTPALTKVELTRGPGREQSYTLTLAVDRGEITRLPEPKDSELYLSTLPAMNVYVKKYVGRSEGNNFNREAQEFKKSLSKHDYHRDFFYTAGYDSPFKLFNTRNEIWYVKK